MNSFPGIVIFIISGFYLVMSVINEIKNRCESQKRCGKWVGKAFKKGWGLLYGRGEL